MARGIPTCPLVSSLAPARRRATRWEDAGKRRCADLHRMRAEPGAMRPRRSAETLARRRSVRSWAPCVDLHRSWIVGHARRAVAGEAGDAVDACRLKGLGQGHRRQHRRRSPCQPWLARSGRADEKDVVGTTPASRSPSFSWTRLSCAHDCSLPREGVGGHACSPRSVRGLC